MLKRRKKTKTTISNPIQTTHKTPKYKEMLCRECNDNFEIVPIEVGAVICSLCVQRMIIAPPVAAKKTMGEGFPRGWHLKIEFRGPDGRVFSRGKEITESELVQILKAAEKPIKIAKIKKPKAPTPVKSGFPRGWHFKKTFRAPDGRVFVRGVEIKKEK